MYYGMHGKTCFARLRHVIKLVIRIVISATILTTKQQKRYSDFAFGYLLFLCILTARRHCCYLKRTVRTRLRRLVGGCGASVCVAVRVTL